jgi:hypothetical protein
MMLLGHSRVDRDAAALEVQTTQDDRQNWERRGPISRSGGMTPDYVQQTVAETVLYCDGSIGDDNNDGLTPATPKKDPQKIFDLLPFMVRHHCRLALSGVFTETKNLFLEKMVARDRVLILDGGEVKTQMSALAGVGGSFSKSGNTVTINAAKANITANLKGKTIVFQGVTTESNGGAFSIAKVLSPTEVQFTNASGVPDAFAGRWTILPFDTKVSGNGDSLVFSNGIVTLTDKEGDFTQADVGKKITIAGATTPKNNGTFLIASVVSQTQVTYANPLGKQEPFSGAWTLGGYVADSASPSHLGLTSADWGKDQWEGLQVEILSGPTKGKTRTVHGNDVAESGSAPMKGKGGSFHRRGKIVTLTSSAGAWKQYHVGKKITIVGSKTKGNNGVFEITAVLAPAQVQYRNPAGKTEKFPGTWTMERSFTTSADNVTLVDCNAQFTTRLVGKKITIAGAKAPGNNGTFFVTAVDSPASLTYANPAGVGEKVYKGTWTTENGWITPTRNWSKSPIALGVDTEFRFVRPATQLNSSNDPSELRIKNLGLGTLVVQGLSIDGSKASVLANGSPGQITFADVALTGTIASQLRVLDCASVSFLGTHYSPTTYAPLTKNSEPFVGVGSTAAPASKNITISVRGLQTLQVSGVVCRNIFWMGKVQQYLIDSGCRIGSLIYTDTYTLRPNGAIRTTDAYAPTKFGGHGITYTFAAAGVVVAFNSAANFGPGILVEDCFYHGIEVHQGYLDFDGDVKGCKIAGAGVFAWLQSIVKFSTAPTITGELGDLVTTYTEYPKLPQPVGTWKEIDAGKIISDKNQMTMAIKAKQLY